MATQTSSSTSPPPNAITSPSSTSSNGASTSHSTASSSISAPRPPIELPMPSSSSSSSNPSLIEGVQSIHPQDLLHVHEMPCARNALLFGLFAGFGLGGLHFVLRGVGSSRRGKLTGASPSAAAWRSMNYFVGAWALGSIGSFKFCQVRRDMERQGIGRAREAMERKKREKEAEAKAMRDALRQRREEATREEEERRRSYWGLGRWILPASKPLPLPAQPAKPARPDGTEQMVSKQAENRRAESSAQAAAAAQASAGQARGSNEKNTNG